MSLRATIVCLAVVATSATASTNITQQWFNNLQCSGTPAGGSSQEQGVCGSGNGMIYRCTTPARGQLCVTELMFGNQRDCTDGSSVTASSSFFCDVCAMHMTEDGNQVYSTVVGCNTSAPMQLENCTDSACAPASCASRTPITQQCVPMKFGGSYVSQSVARCGAVTTETYAAVDCSGSPLSTTLTPTGVCINGGMIEPCTP